MTQVKVAPEKNRVTVHKGPQAVGNWEQGSPRHTHSQAVTTTNQPSVPWAPREHRTVGPWGQAITQPLHCWTGSVILLRERPAGSDITSRRCQIASGEGSAVGIPSVPPETTPTVLGAHVTHWAQSPRGCSSAPNTGGSQASAGSGRLAPFCTTGPNV